ncbi:MAG: ribosome-associated translation inhibitor RaiA [Flavobacteriaceae bacterium]|nr:ribosome-associated translation inhibitor RaiA [Mangrovimonas sp.]MCB0438474.1 ribosome-associated translation inhibitor RaiA [Mangrovimonas sp.]HPF95847.1 ribosome-associated translation inhibitor RaiA [Mangrovimonas sp.]HRV54591.1 ribosome-associated translation inhibitor RaiA [Mangrovimonas sp.]
MTVNIQYVNMDSSESLSTYTKEKLEKLAKKYDWLISCDVAFKLEGKDNLLGHICNMELSLPGPKIFATSNEKNYEMAVKETISDLDKQLQKRKQQFAHH